MVSDAFLQEVIERRFPETPIEVVKQEGKYVILHDTEFGEYKVQRSHLLRKENTGRCWKRFQKERNACETAEDVQKKLDLLFDYVITIDASTFSGTHKKARFFDPEYGEFWQKPNNTLSLKQGHPERGKRNREETNLSRYGVANQAQRPELKEKLSKDRDKITAKIKKTLRARYGVDHWMKTEQGKSNFRNKIRKNPKNWVKTEEGWKRRKKRSLTKRPGLKEFCKKNEVPYSTAVSYQKRGLDFAAIKEIRQEGDSSLERFFLSKIGGKKNHKRFGNSTPDIEISNDIFVECDGLYWHSENKIHQPQRHIGRRKALESLSKTLLQFREDEITQKPEIVKSIIDTKLGKNSKIFARKLKLKEIGSAEAREFFERNHLMGMLRGVKTFALIDEKGEPFCAMAVRRKKETLVIERFACKCGWTVVGGLSRVLAHAKNQYEGVKEIISWVDRRYADGHSLTKLGFQKEKTVLSWKWTDFKTTYNRLHCTANMDARGLSEKEHAAEMGLYRIYDAGQTKFSKTLTVPSLEEK